MNSPPPGLAGASAAPRPLAASSARRHLWTRFAFSPCVSATLATDVPGCAHATSTRAFNSSLCRRRGSRLGGCRALGRARAGESFGASLGVGEACGWPTQLADNDEWHRKSPRPSGLILKWG